MFNDLIPRVLSYHNFTKTDARGRETKGVRLLTCNLGNEYLQSKGSLSDIISYCESNNIKIDCYECYNIGVSSIENVGSVYNNSIAYRVHRLSSLDIINKLISVIDDFYYNEIFYCKFVPMFEGDITIEGDILYYYGGKKMFILPCCNYRHIETTFYNKLFINLKTNEIIGKYAGLDVDKNYIETEEIWDSETNNWRVLKQKVTDIVGFKEML